jgi:hypothetical protein
MDLRAHVTKELAGRAQATALALMMGYHPLHGEQVVAMQ